MSKPRPGWSRGPEDPDPAPAPTCEIVGAGECAMFGIRCRICGFTSWNPHDVSARFCPKCKTRHEELSYPA